MSYFCNGKKGFCNKFPCTDACEFYDGSGGEDIETVADRIRQKSDEDLSRLLFHVMHMSQKTVSVEQVLELIQKPAEESGDNVFLL